MNKSTYHPLKNSKTKLFFLFFLFALLLSLIQKAESLLFVPTTLEQAVNRAGFIFEGRVLSSEVRPAPDRNHGQIIYDDCLRILVYGHCLSLQNGRRNL